MDYIWDDEELLEACKVVDNLKNFSSKTKVKSKYKHTRKYTKHVVPFTTQVKQYQDRLYFSTGENISFSEARTRFSKIKKDMENKEKRAYDRNEKISIKRKQKPFVILDDFDSDSETIAIDPS